ncbi:sigma factor [Streptomyces sp. CO7]
MQTELEDRFQEFVRARWPRLVRTAYLLTGDRHLAEDLTQTALAKAYRSWRRVLRADSPEAYVRRILVSCNSDRFRKRRVPESLTAAVPERAGGDEGARADTRGTLVAAPAALPARSRWRRTSTRRCSSPRAATPKSTGSCPSGGAPSAR